MVADNPEESAPQEAAVVTKKPRLLTIKIEDVFQARLASLYRLGKWSDWHYQNLYENGIKLYMDGKLITPDDAGTINSTMPTIERADWAKIGKVSNEKIQKIYKAHLGKGGGLDDIRAKLEQISDKVKDYQAVLPSFVSKIVKAQTTIPENPDRSDSYNQMIQRQQVSDSLRRLGGQVQGAHRVFEMFLFPRNRRYMSGNEYVDFLVSGRIDIGNDYTMSLQQSADDAEQVMNLINSYNSDSELGPMKSPINISTMTEAEQIVKYPICEECSSELLSECADCGEEYLKEDLDYLNTDDEPICEGCTESYMSCDNCSILIYTGDYDGSYHTTEDGDIYCSNCYKEVLGIDADTMTEYLNDTLSEGVFGVNTPHETGGTTQTALLPIPSILLTRAMEVLRRLKHNDIITLAGSRFRSPEATEAMPKKVQAQFQSQGMSSEDSIILVNAAKGFLKKKLDTHSDITQDESQTGMNSFIESLQRQVNSTNSFYDRYPLTKRDPDGNIVAVKRELESGKRKRLEMIRKFHPIPVDYKVTESRYNDIPSFTIVMSPSSRMIEMSKSIFGEKGEDAWNLLSRRGTQHHRGAIAYARISKVEDESLVINNFQRDSDIYNLGKELLNSYKESDPNLYDAIRWWDKKIKFWHVQFLLTLMEFAKKQNEALFFTPFEVQKMKWSTVPERNRDVYDKVPAEMMAANRAGLEEFYADREEEEREEIIEEELFPRMEPYEGRVESLSSSYDLWRLAEDFERKRLLTKIAMYVA
jgi:hypothetical protein